MKKEKAFLRLGFTESGEIRIEGKGLSVEGAAYAFGQVLNEVGGGNLPEDCRDWWQRRDYFHSLARIFCQGLSVDENAISWMPAEEIDGIPHDWRNTDLSEVVAVSCENSERVSLARYDFTKGCFRKAEGGGIIKDVIYWKLMPKAPLRIKD